MSERKLNWRTRKFFRLYVKYGNATKAGLEAWNFKSENAAAVHASRTLRKHKIVLAEIMDVAGITDDKLMEVLKDGLDATEMIVDGKGDNATYVPDAPDFKTRHRYMESGMKLKGHLSNDVNIALPPEVIVKLNDGHLPVSTEPESTR